MTQSSRSISITRNGHCACAMSRNLSQGAKIIHILKPLTPIWLFTLSQQGILVVPGTVVVNRRRRLLMSQTDTSC